MEIIIVLIAVLLFLAGLLALPVDLRFALEKDERLEYRAELRWLFGFLSLDISKPGKKEAKRPPPKRRKREGKKARMHFGSLFGNRALIRRFYQLIGELLRSFQVRELELHGRIGLGDPAYTGMLLGLLNPLLLTCRHTTLEADFQEALFEGYCKGEIRFVPIRAVGALLAFGLSPVTLRALLDSRAGRRGGNEG